MWLSDLFVFGAMLDAQKRGPKAPWEDKKMKGKDIGVVICLCFLSMIAMFILSMNALKERDQCIKELKAQLDLYRNPVQWSDSTTWKEAPGVNPDPSEALPPGWRTDSNLMVYPKGYFDKNAKLLDLPRHSYGPVVQIKDAEPISCSRCGELCHPYMEYHCDGQPTLYLCGRCVYDQARSFIKLCPKESE